MNRFIPTFLYALIKKVYYATKLAPYYFYWFKYDIKYSNLFNTKKADLSGIMVAGHVLEKGLTMPDFRSGFGYNRVRDIIDRSCTLIDKYGADYIEIQSALNDLEQYLDVHNKKNFKLPEDIEKGIVRLLKKKTMNTEPCHMIKSSEFFKSSIDFKDFAKQRHSVRWFSNETIEDTALVEVVKLAQTAPSACNKQSIKVYVISSNEIKVKVLEIQRGNRGFGHKAPNILLITSNMGCWNFQFRTSAFIDGGIFVQNLLYALHYHKFVACTMNAELSPKQIRQLREIIRFDEAEIPIAFIAIGRAIDEFVYPGSQRINVEDVIKFV